MDKLIFDEELFLPHYGPLSRVIKTALLDFLARIVDNPDNPDLVDIIGTERDGHRASQFTSGYILDWEVTRRRSGWMVGLSSGTPEEVTLWDIRGPFVEV